jgi:sec-independent protein translocase protein TatB
MFGMGFSEILIIAVIAILFLGPDKLPQTMIDIARFFRSAKRTLASAKASIEEELHVEDIKREVSEYKENLLEEKAHLQQQVSSVTSVTDLTDEFDTVIDMAGDTPTVTKPASDSAKSTPYAEADPKASKPEVVTFSKKKKRPDEDGDGKEV